MYKILLGLLRLAMIIVVPAAILLGVAGIAELIHNGLNSVLSYYGLVFGVHGILLVSYALGDI